MEKIIIECLESRVQTNRSMYARFLLGPFKDDNAITIATALRRSLLSKVKSIAITAIHIQGVTHEFSTIVGVRESVLDLALNFQQVVLRTKTGTKKKGKLEGETTPLEKAGNKPSRDQTVFGPENLHNVEPETVKVGYLQIQGPAVVYANDLKLPAGIECVDPSQYIATLSTEGILVLKFLIAKKKAGFNTNHGAWTGNKANVDLAKTEPNFVGAPLHAKTKGVRANRFEKQSRSSSVSAEREGLQKEPSTVNRVQPSPTFQTATPLLAKTGYLHTRTDPQTSPFDPTISFRNTIFLDPLFDSVTQVNYVIEKDDLFNQARERVILEFWTNGSVHPRQALHKASLSLISTFSIFRKVFHLDSL